MDDAGGFRRHSGAFYGDLWGISGFKGVFMDDSRTIWGLPGVFRVVSAGLGLFQMGVRETVE